MTPRLRPEAGELIRNVQVAMLAGAPYRLLRDAIFTHPTMLERLIGLFNNVLSASVPVSEEQVAFG
jgi:hypothetical protein